MKYVLCAGGCEGWSRPPQGGRGLKCVWCISYAKARRVALRKEGADCNITWIVRTLFLEGVALRKEGAD